MMAISLSSASNAVRHKTIQKLCVTVRANPHVAGLKMPLPLEGQIADRSVV